MRNLVPGLYGPNPCQPGSLVLELAAGKTNSELRGTTALSHLEPYEDSPQKLGRHSRREADNTRWRRPCLVDRAEREIA